MYHAQSTIQNTQFERLKVVASAPRHHIETEYILQRHDARPPLGWDAAGRPQMRRPEKPAREAEALPQHLWVARDGVSFTGRTRASTSCGTRQMRSGAGGGARCLSLFV